MVVFAHYVVTGGQWKYIRSLIFKGTWRVIWLFDRRCIFLSKLLIFLDFALVYDVILFAEHVEVLEHAVVGLLKLTQSLLRIHWWVSIKFLLIRIQYLFYLLIIYGFPNKRFHWVLINWRLKVKLWLVLIHHLFITLIIIWILNLLYWLFISYCWASKRHLAWVHYDLDLLWSKSITAWIFYCINPLWMKFIMTWIHYKSLFKGSKILREINKI